VGTVANGAASNAGSEIWPNKRAKIAETDAIAPRNRANGLDSVSG
jgi:hypothetical protein